MPSEVAWVDEKMALYALGSWHGNWFLVGVDPQKYIPHPDEEPRERTTRRAKSGKSDGEMNANGKRSLEAGDGPAVPPKRRRIQDKTEAGPPRRSTRIRKDAGGEPAPNPGPIPNAISSSAPKAVEQIAGEQENVDMESIKPSTAVDAVEPRAVVEAIEPGATVEATESGATTEVVEPASAVEARSEGEEQETPAAQTAKGTRSKRSRARRSTIGMKRKGSRKSRVPSGHGDTPSELPAPAPPAPTPLSPSPAPVVVCIPPGSATPSFTPPSPATGEVVDEVPPLPDSGETTAAASRESTAAGTPVSGLSTCVGTPPQEHEVKVEPVAMKLKGIRVVLAPVRASARIHAKKLAMASQQ